MWVSYYWHLGLSEADMAVHILDHFDQSKYGLRLVSHSTFSYLYDVNQLHEVTNRFSVHGKNLVFKILDKETLLSKLLLLS